MRRVKLIVMTAAFALLALATWQVGAAELANLELQDDMQDLASQTGIRARYNTPSTDDGLRDAVVRKAQEHDIQLAPEQITVRRSGVGFDATVSLAADYTVAVRVPGYSFVLHFTPSSEKRGL